MQMCTVKAGMDLCLKQLNPSVQSSGVVLFDVPTGRRWVMVTGRMTSGETAKIQLN